MAAGQRRYRPYEMELMVNLWRKKRQEGMGRQQAYKAVAEELGVSWEAVQRIVVRLSPTTSVAQDLIKANAMRLASRLIRKANSDQIINILERPNIGVLAPKQDSNGGSGGFFLSVSADTCGAVNVKAGQMPQGWVPPALTPAPSLLQEEAAAGAEEPIEASVIYYSEGEETAKVEETPAIPRFGKSKAYLAAVEAARKRLKNG